MGAAEPKRAHAILSASGSRRWLECPPSARLEEQFPEESSEYAAEGSFAHELAELHLNLHLKIITKQKFNSQLKKLSKNSYYSQEMLDYVQDYVDIVIERVNEAYARSKDAVVLIEQILDFSAWVPEGFGTGDTVIIADGTCEVIDLKYGKGVPVSAINNSQMRLYGLGAFEHFDLLYGIQTVRMTVVQPRLDNVSTEELTAEELLNWAETAVKPKAGLAIAGEGDFTAGDHCRFCRARYVCRKRAEANLELAEFEFRKPPTLSLDEICDVLTQAVNLQAWVSDIQDYALDQAANFGVKFQGWKLVEGRSNRKYADEKAVTKTLLDEKYEEDTIMPRKLLGITAMEKAIGKKQFKKLLSDLVIKPPGKPKLAPESDNRSEISSAASAAKDFKN